jgi:glycosyltransferase involved in cell wall biosynthesis
VACCPLIESANVSVITPTKNRRVLLGETIDSVRCQTYPAWEHIIVDDGSNDDTAEEVQKRAESDARIRFIRRTSERPGASSCRNIGLRDSRANLIVFLDSDDLLVPACLERRVAVMHRNQDLDFAVFQTGVFEKSPGDLGRQLDTQLVGDDLLRFLCFECPWQTSAPIWRRSALISLGGFDELLPSWQDIDLHVRAISAGLRYLRFPEVDHYFRWQFEPTKLSVMQRRSPRHLSAASQLLEKFERVVTAGPGMNWVRQRAICGLYFFVAELWVAAGDVSSALSLWRTVRDRSMVPSAVYLSGAGLLALQAGGAPGRRIGGRLIHKWKGWIRMRTNPELLGTQE